MAGNIVRGAYNYDKDGTGYDEYRFRTDADLVLTSDGSNVQNKINVLSTNITNHTSDNTKHLPSGGTTGQYLQKTASGYAFADVSSGGDVDNGRYQSAWGLEDAVLTNIVVSNNSIKLDYTKGSTATATATGSTQFGVTVQHGIKIHVNNNLSGIIVTIDDITSKFTRLKLLNSSKTVIQTINTTVRKNTIIYNFIANTDYYIVIDNNGSAYDLGSNSANFPYNSTDVNIIGALSDSTDTTVTTRAFSSVQALFDTVLTGNVIKTYTPNDLKKWGNVKFSKTTPINTNVVCDVMSSNDVMLKSNIQSLQDLSDIDTTQYPSLKFKWTLSRNSVSDVSPTVSNPSVTWEGRGNDGAWEKIAETTLIADTVQVDFVNLGLENYRYLQLILELRNSTSSAASLKIVFNDDFGANYYADTTTAGTYLIYSLYVPANTNAFSFMNLIISNETSRDKAVVGYGRDTWKKTSATIYAQSWDNKTSKITKISVSPSANSLQTGSRLILMGVK